jgi:hypothetical protein
MNHGLLQAHRLSQRPPLSLTVRGAPPWQDWVSFDAESSTRYFSAEEMESLPAPNKQTRCDEDGALPAHCCLGASTAAGFIFWDAKSCPRPEPFLKFLMPHNSK